MTRIFISYRRDDSETFTGRLCDCLRGHFGTQSVFLDVDNIPYGVDFRTHLRAALSQCDAVLVVIGREWLGSQENGRRLDDPRDPVRVEIETAFEKQIPVIPITIKDTPMPGEETLPESLRPLAFRNACTIDTGRDFHPHVERLIANLRVGMADTSAGAAAPANVATAASASEDTGATPRESVVASTSAATVQPSSSAPSGDGAIKLGCTTTSGIGFLLTISTAAVMLVMLGGIPGRWRSDGRVDHAMASRPDDEELVDSELKGVLHSPDSTGQAVAIEDFAIEHIGNEGDRMDFTEPLFDDRPTLVQDDLTVEAKFAVPAYCFLFALNPDGVVQLCYPATDDEAQAEPIRALQYPADEGEAFGLTDGAGHQAFVLVTSARPLPPFAQWKADFLAGLNWPDETISGNWVYSHGEMVPRSFSGDIRSQVRGDVRPKRDPGILKQWLQRTGQRGPYQVECVIFEVHPR